MIKFSIVIPIKNEDESINELHEELVAVFDALKQSYEFVFIDDGSTDHSYQTLLKLQEKDKRINIIKLRANFGKSYALSQGFDKSQGEIIIILDADLQDDPNEIPKMLEKIDNGYDLVNGWRKKREDNSTKKISSSLFNAGTSFISGLHLHDFNCGLKVFKKEVAEELNLRGELHRFIPVLAFKNKFKVTEIAVNHRKRKYGISKYGKLGIMRSWKGMLDLLTAIFITDYANKPAHFFGAFGLTFFTIGFILDAYVSFIKITTGTTQGKIPLLLAGILLILLGVQLISTGLIAEMLSHYLNKKQKKSN